MENRLNPELKVGIYEERESVVFGEYRLCFFDGTEKGGLWIEDINSGEGGQFKGDCVVNAVDSLFKKYL